MLDFTLTFGKYQGRNIRSMCSIEEANYLNWIVNRKLVPRWKQEIILAHLAGK